MRRARRKRDTSVLQDGHRSLWPVGALWLLTAILWTTQSAAAVIMHASDNQLIAQQHAAANSQHTTFTEISQQQKLTHFRFTKLPLPPQQLSAVPVSPTSAKIQWSPTAGNSREGVHEGSDEEEVFSVLAMYSVEGPGRPTERTQHSEVIEEGLRSYGNATLCVRLRQVMAEPRIVLESQPTCLSGVHGSPPKIVKPLFIAVAEIVALSLVIGAVSCIVIHFALERLKVSLTQSPQHTADGAQYDECLKGWLREEDEDRELDERSRIMGASKATSV